MDKQHDRHMHEETIELNVASLLPQIVSAEDDCIQRLQQALLKQEGINQVHLQQDPLSLVICLRYDPNVHSEAQLLKLVEKTSSKITKRYQHDIISIEGMDCSDCALVLEHGLSRKEGVLNVSVSYADQELWVEYDVQQIGRRGIEQSIRRMGYDIPKVDLIRFLHDNQAIILSVLSGVFLFLAWSSNQLLNLPQQYLLGAYILSYLLGGFELLSHSVHQILRERRVDIDLLMLAAALGAAILGKWPEGALLIFLFSLGHALESRAMKHARKAILSLSDLAPRTARLLRDGKEEVVPIQEIQIGDTVLVPPGSRYAVDQYLNGTIEEE